MPEYKALAQNTLKITTEMTLNHNTELGAPLVNNYPRIKRLTIDRKSVEYINLLPCDKKSMTNTKFGVCNAYSAISSTDYYSMVNAGKDLYTLTPAVAVLLDGKMYYGQKSAAYICSPVFKCSSTKGQAVSVVLDAYIPAAKVKAVIYSQSGGTIVTKETIVPKFECDTYATNAPSSTYSYYGAFSFGLLIEKEENDIVLAIEIEYPKYDITIASAVEGMKYSLDDGLTFNDVYAGLELPQVEHIVFKNPASPTKTISTLDGTQICTIDAGKTYVAVPEASGDWHIT